MASNVWKPHYKLNQMRFELAFSLYIKYKTLLHEQPGEFWHNVLFTSFWLFLALFPIGYGWREVMPPLCFIFLIIYYKYEWKNSVLRRLKPKWLFLCAIAMLIIGICFSRDPLFSLAHAGAGLNKGFILPFIGMECCRDGKELRCLVWAYVFACFWEGLDGVWQACAGYDFIMGYTPNDGRLTGSLGDYTVGNYLALALVPAFSIWFILRESQGRISSIFIVCAFFWPAFFLFQGASSRSGILAIAGALFLWTLLSCKHFNWRAIAYPALAFLAFILCQPMRLAPERIINDNRWDLWRLAWEVFKEQPFFGAGAGRYNAAFRELGLAPEHEVITISHPHDLYLDILYAHGAIGFLFGIIFLFGFLFWGYSHIRPATLAERAAGTGIYWQLAAWFWLGYAAWLINGIFGHDFYRTWWLALAMSSLGIMIGAVVNGEKNPAPQ